MEEPGQEVTERDHFFTDPKPKEEENPSVEDIVDAEVEAFRETLEFVALYGKSLKFNETPDTATTISEQENFDITTSKAPEVENETEISEVTDKIATTSSSEEEEEEGEKEKNPSTLNKSSEEDTSDAELRQIATDKSEESSEEKKISENEDTQHVNLLTDEIFKESTAHEVRKKDHPDGLILPDAVTESDIGEEGRQSDVNILADLLDEKTQATITAIYDTFEDVVTTANDGIKLTNELRQNLNSFRDYNQEDETVLETMREVISSEDSKADLLISDEMKVEESRQFSSEISVSIMAIASLIALISMSTLVGMFFMVKRRAERIYFI